MKKLFLFAMTLILSVSVMAQQKIQLRSADKAECVKSDMTSLKASFSFSTIDAQDYQSERGTFSWLSLPNTVVGGNEGDPQIPVVNELIAVPFGASPRIEITSYSTTDYRLEDYEIHTLVPRQPSLRKDQRPEEVPFVYNASAYQTRGLRSAPQAVVSVEGTMRGIQVGKMTIEPVTYDPVNNTIRVFNDIEVTVHSDGADVRATEEMLVKTYTPYFDVVYAQMFNSRMLRDAYSEHPDLYSTPVKMMVITTSTYANNQTFQDWVNWKKQKGFYTTVYTTATTGTTAASIKSFIRNKYSTEAPTFVIIVGDTDAVTYSLSSSTTDKVTDLYYSTTDDNDLWPEMFLSRMPISSTTELENLLNKIMTYEKYTMADPSYLSKVLLIAGSDGTWNPRVGQPTINYAADNYFNTAHGFTNVYKYLDSYTNCYANMNTGIGFANYTAHGGETGWSGPSFSVSDANNLTNADKYFWAMGNCCLAANWGYSGVCLAEALLRSQNKGAFGYIGSCPETYWWEDYYFGVGATTVTNSTPSMSQTQTGTYDGMFMDDMYNTLNSVPFLGNVAVAYAHANSYTSSVTDKYYWEAYHTLGDGSVMPYHVNPSANNVSHASAIGIGLTTFTVNADPGSYVAISKDNELLGAAQVDGSGTVNVPITPVTSGGDVLIVVTRNQRQPYMQTIPAVSLEGPYISIDGYTPNSAHVGDNTNLSISFKNVGADATTGNTTVTLTAVDSNATIVANTGTQTFGALAANATITVSGFQFKINSGVADGTIVPLHYRAVNGSNTWEGNFNVTAGEAVLEYQNMAWNGGFTPGETLTLTAKFKNTGHYQATNAVATMSTSSNYITINTTSVNVGTIAVDQEVSCQFSVTIKANCPETAQIPVTFTLNANGGLTATGNETLKNACNVVFNLSDSYGDGWNGSSMTVSFSDGSPSQTLTIESGNSAVYTLEIGNGTHVTLTWTSGSQWDSECSFTVSYEDDLLIYQTNGAPSAGVLYEFDCNCGAATQTFTITVTSSNTEQGTVTGGGEFSYGQSCTVTATPAEGYMFTGWTMNGEMVSSAAEYTFNVTSNMDLVANFAEGTMIGDGEDATSNYLPSYNYYNYSLTQQIYTSAELGGAGIITSIAFYNAGAEKTRKYDFYMKNTTKSSFTNSTDWIAVSNSDKVFSGNVTLAANEWTIITFNTPFIYDGSSNVVLVADDNTGGYTNSPHMACRVFDAPSQAIYVNSDGTNYNPNSPSSYTGTVFSKKNQILITKEAISTEPVNITVSVNPAQAGTVNGDGEYDFGETCMLSVTPNEGYFFIGWTENGEVVSSELEFSFSATSDREFVANFVQGIEIGESSTNNAYLPSYNYYNYSLTQQIYTAEEIGNAGTISWIAFYNEGAAKTRTYDFYLKATEKTNFSSNADWITVAASDKVFSGSITMAENTWTIINFTTPFEYDGTSNLVLVADDNSGGYTGSPHMTCSVFNANGNQAIYIYQDGTNFDPMSPPTASSSNNEVLSVKNHILLGIEAAVVEQTVTLNQGTNWWSTNLDITLDQLKDAIATAVGNSGTATIKSQNGSISLTNGQWRPVEMDFDIREMYQIVVSSDYEITLTGVPVNPSEYEITIHNGINWIGFLSSESMTIEEAFAGLNPVIGDVIKSKETSATYTGSGWRGELNTIEPGHGYIYQSKALGERTFTF